MFYILGVLITGLIVGAIARFVLPGRDPMGCLGTILVGIGGAFVGGLIGRQLFGEEYVPGFLMSVAGAVILLLIVRQFRRPRRGPRM